MPNGLRCDVKSLMLLLHTLQRVPCEFDASINGVMFEMPPLPSASSALATARSGDGGGDAVATTADAVSAEPVDAPAPVSKHVTVSLSFGNAYYLESSAPTVFSYYGACWRVLVRCVC